MLLKFLQTTLELHLNSYYFIVSNIHNSCVAKAFYYFFEFIFEISSFTRTVRFFLFHIHLSMFGYAEKVN